MKVSSYIYWRTIVSLGAITREPEKTSQQFINGKKNKNWEISTLERTLYGKNNSFWKLCTKMCVCRIEVQHRQRVALCLRVFYDTISKLNPNRMWMTETWPIDPTEIFLPLMAMVSWHCKKIINDISWHLCGCRKKTHPHLKKKTTQKTHCSVIRCSHPPYGQRAELRIIIAPQRWKRITEKLITNFKNRLWIEIYKNK